MPEVPARLRDQTRQHFVVGAVIVANPRQTFFQGEPRAIDLVSIGNDPCHRTQARLAPRGAPDQRDKLVVDEKRTTGEPFFPARIDMAA